MRTLTATSILALSLFGAPAALAQSSVVPLETAYNNQPPPGWSFSPALDYAFAWDSNVLMENVGSTIVGEQLHIFKPRGMVGFVGQRGDFNVNYTGAFVQHTDLSSLNSYDQRLTVDATRLLTRRTSFVVHSGTIVAPTTALVELVGVPFTRIGSRRQDVRAGIVSLLSRRTELTADYNFQWVDFEDDPNALTTLNGGSSHGAMLGLTRALTERLSLTADYDLTLGTMVNTAEDFTLQNARGGLEYALAADTHVFGSVGASYLASLDTEPSQIGPSVRVGITRDVRDARVSAVYSRSYVPSYGFGGTSDNEELTAEVQVPVTARLSIRTAMSVRRNEPLDTLELPLRSLWFHGSIGYLIAPWARIEGYAAGSRQVIDRPDGRVNRYTFGLQLTAVTTTRIR